MRILAILNRYPPHHLGGYELRFREVVEGLVARGHDLIVLTSTHGLPKPGREGRVRRELTLLPEIHGLKGIFLLLRVTLRDDRALCRAVADHRPDVLYLGSPSGLTSALLGSVERLRLPYVLDVSNLWLFEVLENHGNWYRIWEKRSRSPLTGAPKAVAKGLLRLGPAALSPRFPGLSPAAVTVTAEHLRHRYEELREPGMPPARLLRSGIRLEEFPFRPKDRPPTRLLYVGRLKALKGVHTAIAALSHLPAETTLTVVGIPDDQAYEERLRREAPPGRVDFREPVERSRLPAVFAEHDLLVFPTEGEEAFSRLLLEAMACGLPVLATPSGGTKELVIDGENGLLFAAGDARALAARVTQLASEPATRKRIVAAGRRIVEEEYGLDAAVSRIEAVLLEVIP